MNYGSTYVRKLKKKKEMSYVEDLDSITARQLLRSIRQKKKYSKTEREGQKVCERNTEKGKRKSRSIP